MLPIKLQVKFLLSVIVLGLSVTATDACNVPVFRYALERWDADLYYAVVVHGPGGLSEGEQSSYDLLRQCSISDTGVMNLDVYQYDREALANSQFAHMFDDSGGKTDGATVHLFHPFSAEKTGPLWEAPLTQANVHRLLADPDRLELLNKITSGTSIVMIMLESGNAEADEAAWDKLTAGILATSESLGLPEGIVMPDGTVTGDGRASMDPADQLWSSIPLKLEFSLQRISRTDTNAVLIQSLLSIDPDLQDRTGSPMVFPVFGRGRFLYPMVADDITEDNVLHASYYVCGACSCEIKVQNPGMELPLLMDWEAIFQEKEQTIRMEQFIDEETAKQPDDSGLSIKLDLDISNRDVLIGFIFIGAIVLVGIIFFMKKRLS